MAIRFSFSTIQCRMQFTEIMKGIWLEYNWQQDEYVDIKHANKMIGIFTVIVLYGIFRQVRNVSKCVFLTWALTDYKENIELSYPIDNPTA